MPPKARRDAGPRAVASPSASLHSSEPDSPTLPGDASPDDNPVLAIRQDFTDQHASLRGDAAELRAAVLAMSNLLITLAVRPPAAPPIANADVLVNLLTQLQASTLAGHEDRRAAREDARLAQTEAYVRADAAAAVRLAERASDEAERARCRREELAR